MFHDEATQGRTRSLAASLNYGFEHAFNETERKQLALLHLFQGFVNVVTLGRVAGITPEAAARLLDRAAEVGLLTGHGGGYYSIHPALPWFFRALFEQQGLEACERASRAYVESIGSLGDYYRGQYEGGERRVTGALKAEEPNLLHARALAKQRGWWPEGIGAMQGLQLLYRHTARTAEWARLVEEIVPDFINPATEGPLVAREGVWSLVTGYRVEVARGARKWDEAERLQWIRVEWDRRHAREEDRHSIRILAASLHELGEIRREMGRPECAKAYQEAFDVAMRIQDSPNAAAAAFNLGNAYLKVPELHNLDESESWYGKSLDLRAKGDLMARAGSIGQLGTVALERFREARAAKKPEAELTRHLNDALGRCQEALKMTPPDAVGQLAVAHNQMGVIYFEAGDLDRALHHYREAIRLQEVQGNLHGTAETRYNVALALVHAGRLPDARQYAQAALSDFQTYGAGAAQDVQDALDLISQIAKAATA